LQALERVVKEDDCNGSEISIIGRSTYELDIIIFLGYEKKWDNGILLPKFCAI
jgi:hypothetical protein